MNWMLQIKMYSHDRQQSWWADCCGVETSEMLGITERALSQSQTVRVMKWDREAYCFKVESAAMRTEPNGGDNG